MRADKLNFLRLGARAHSYDKLGVGNKARLLNVAIRAGLPVPSGITLLDGGWARLIRDGILTLTGDDVIVESADELLERFALTDLRRPVAVRSAFAAEDGADSALAGYFLTRLNIAPDDRAGLIHALIDVWRSAERQPGRFRRDMLVMEMVGAQVAGVAFSEAAYQDDLVNYTDGTGDQLVGGKVAGAQISLPQLRGLEHSDLPHGWQRRLQLLLRGVRRSLSLEGRDWDIEWADDGRVCWLLQVRPVTRSPRRNEAFTFANLREILPDPPSPFMTGVVLAASHSFFDWYRQFDRTLPANRPMVELFYGRPLFNIALLTDMMRHWGLPSALVTGAIGGAAAHASGFRLSRFLAKSLVLLRLGWSQLNAVRYANQHTPQLRARAAQPGATFSAVSATFRDLFVSFVTEMFNLTQAMSGPLLILRRAGLLTGLGGQTVATELYDQLAALRAQVAAQPALADALRAGRLPDDPAFRAAWQAFLRDHGQRGIYESDIARPRYSETQPALLQSLAGAVDAPITTRNTAAERPIPLWARPFWWQLRRVQAARERWRYETMHAYADVRARLLALAAQATANGQLPQPDALWWLTLPEVAALDDGAIYTADAIAERQAQHAALAAIDLPDLLYRFDEPQRATADVDADGYLRGVSLTDGSISGRAWVLHEPALTLPPGFAPADTILVARSVDAGWIATFGQVAGVVVEIGGDLSHGSIILRELGLPAITNVRGVTQAVQTGDRLRLEAGRGALERLPVGEL